MNIKNSRPFELAQIEIVALCDCDVITASGFPGEDDDFDVAGTYYWERNK